MEPEKILGVTELLGIEPDSFLVPLIEGTFDYLPYIGKVYNAYKMHRFQVRVKRIEERLSNFSYRMSESNDEALNEFIRKKAFPFALNELLEEQEEEKIDLIMNGIEYVYNQEIREESKVLVYFDVLRELRVDELKKLIKFSSAYKKRGIRSKLELNLPPEDRKEMGKYLENQGYASYIDNHLEKLGLLDTGLRSLQETIEEMYHQLGNAMNSSVRSSSFRKSNEPKLTQFGEYFINFFELTDLIEIPAE